MCKKAQDEGAMQRIRVAKKSPRVNHILFADDTLFFCKTSASNVSTLTGILKQYGTASGQCINQAKSAITFSSKATQEAKDMIENSLEIHCEGGGRKVFGSPRTFWKE